MLFNPAAAAGRSRQRFEAAAANLRERGVTVAEHQPSTEDEARSVLADLATSAERVVVVGGDGMVHLAANALATTGVVLGVIPAGTGNDTATSLGISKDIDEACAQAIGEANTIDLIESEAGFAVTVATVGFSVAVNDRADAMKRVRGSAKYTLASLAELPRMQAFSLMLTLDGVRHEIEANLLAIANTRYFGGGMKVAPSADPTDGALDVVVMGPAPRAVFAAVLPTVFAGLHTKTPFVTTYRARDVVVDSTLAVRADGERFGTLPATFTAHPGALLVAGAKRP